MQPWLKENAVDHPNQSHKFQLVSPEPQQLQGEKSDRLTVAKLNAVKQFNKQDHTSKLMTEKYSLLPLNPQQLTPVQTAIQRMSEKHPDFEIQPVNTIRPPEIE